MPTVSNAVRVTTPRGAVWRTCAGCGRLVAMAPGQVRCGQCQTPAARLREVAGKSADLLRSLRPGRCTTVVANWCPSCANWVRPERFDWPANACVYCLSVKRAGAVA